MLLVRRTCYANETKLPQAIVCMKVTKLYFLTFIFNTKLVCEKRFENLVFNTSFEKKTIQEKKQKMKEEPY